MPNNHLEKREDSKMESIIEFVKKTWIILLGLITIIGSGYTAFDGLNLFISESETGRIILIVSCIFLLALVWYIGCKWWKQRGKVEENVDLAAEKYGFRYNEIEIESVVHADGSGVWKRNFDLEVVGPEIEAIEHRAIVFGDSKIIKPSINVSGTAEGSKISYKTIQQSDKSIIFVIDFSPSLKKGGKAKYTIEEKYGPGFYAMDSNFILDMIKKGAWPCNEPYEEDSYKIAYPTNRLIKKVILPKNYDISGKEYWEVIIGDSSSIAIGEYNRIKKEEDKDFKVTYSEEGNRILKLTVDKPEIGLSYGLKWIPPTKEEYEKILEESKGVGLEAERINRQ
jgi:hypothetical protein